MISAILKNKSTSFSNYFFHNQLVFMISSAKVIFMLTISTSCFAILSCSNHNQPFLWSYLDHQLPLCCQIKLSLLSLVITQVLNSTCYFLVASGTIHSPGFLLSSLSSTLPWPLFFDSPCKNFSVLSSSHSSSLFFKHTPWVTSPSPGIFIYTDDS